MLEILIGLPASGKSSYCKDKLKENRDIEIVSSDAIREEVFGDVNDQSHNGEVFNIVFKRVREAILNNRDVILDATNLSRNHPDYLTIGAGFTIKHNNGVDLIIDSSESGLPIR